VKVTLGKTFALEIGNSTWMLQTNIQNDTSTWIDIPDNGTYAATYACKPVSVAVSDGGEYSLMTNPDGENWTVHNTVGNNMN